MDIVERLRGVNISWSHEGELCAEAADEIIKLREDKKFGFELMDTFVKEINKLKQALYRIANIKSDTEFGALPIATAQKIAQDALEKE